MKWALTFALAVFALMAIWQVVADNSQVTMPVGAHLSTAAESIQQGSVIERMDIMPLAFTENQGQWDERVKFRANVGGAAMWFTEEGVYHQFTRLIPRDNTSPDDPMSLPHDRFDRVPDSVEQLMIKASFVGVNPNSEITGEDLMGYKCNYFLGNDPTEWRTDVPNYQAVCFQGMYPGIDLRFYGNDDIEYDFIVSPGADPSQIRVQYDGAKSVLVDDAGRLVIKTEWGSITERKPYIYQIDGDSRKPIDGEYTLLADNRVGFALSEDYDPDLYAVIDPVIVYSTYLGGSEGDWGEDIAVDEYKSVYLVGQTFSSDFPTVSGFQQINAGDRDIFISKLDSSGTELIYSTYLGGSAEDEGHDIEVDNYGNAYVTGATYSDDFPTENPIQSANSGHKDAILAKLNSTGNSLVFSTYLGGDSWDESHGLAVDENGNAYIVGKTASPDFPTQNEYQQDQPSWDIFVAKVDPAGENLIYSTYFGGSYDEYGYAIAVDEATCVYITGKVGSLDFPILNAFQPTLAGPYNDAFVAKLNSAGNGLVYSTYLGGGSSGETGRGIAADVNGCAYITGYTWSNNFPVENPVQSEIASPERPDAFVTKLSSSGSTLIYSTYLGGDYDDIGYGIVVDVDGCAIVTGVAQSSDFPVVNQLQDNPGMDAAFVTKLDSLGGSLLFSSYLGGEGGSNGYGIAIDSAGDVYLTGGADAGFPIKNAYQSEIAGGGEAFITKIEDCDDLDMDWVCDYGDNCLGVYNPDQEDSDEDNDGDSCDVCPFDADNDIDGDTVCGDVDNCPDTPNPDQLDSDEDEVGDACDICPYHALNDCCNPVGLNEPPTITSEASETVVPGQDFVYMASATDPNCDGSELNLFFIDYPSWLSAEGNTLSGRVECHYEDTTFKATASDGDLADTLEVSLTIDKSNVPPIITDTVDRVEIRSQTAFEYYPTIDDPDDVSHTISYLSYPHWCGVQNDSVQGVAPDTLFVELLTVEVRDYCHADTLSFIVSVYFCGDADGNGEVDIDDVVYLINYIFSGGPPPDPIESGDADCSGGVDIDDVVYLISFIFSGGNAPCDTDGDSVPDC